MPGILIVLLCWFCFLAGFAGGCLWNNKTRQICIAYERVCAEYKEIIRKLIWQMRAHGIEPRMTDVEG